MQGVSLSKRYLHSAHGMGGEFLGGDAGFSGSMKYLVREMKSLVEMQDEYGVPGDGG
jgi:hypothetical protein